MIEVTNTFIPGPIAVYNTVGDPYFEAAHKSLALRGRQILIAAVDRIVQFNILEFYRGQHTYVGIDTLGSARAALSVGGAILTGGLSLLGEAALAKATADPHPCQTALAGGAAAVGTPAKSPAPEPKKEEDGFFGSVRRLFK